MLLHQADVNMLQISSSTKFVKHFRTNLTVKRTFQFKVYFTSIPLVSSLPNFLNQSKHNPSNFCSSIYSRNSLSACQEDDK